MVFHIDVQGEGEEESLGRKLILLRIEMPTICALNLVSLIRLWPIFVFAMFIYYVL